MKTADPNSQSYKSPFGESSYRSRTCLKIPSEQRKCFLRLCKESFEGQGFHRRDVYLSSLGVEAAHRVQHTLKGETANHRRTHPSVLAACHILMTTPHLQCSWAWGSRC